MEKELIMIEKKEKEILFMLREVFEEFLDEFMESYRNSINYLDMIILPTLMASMQKDKVSGKYTTNKSYNPFSEIIEKYSIDFLLKTLKEKGFKALPLGYSSDLTLQNEEENYILFIDIKTANIDNTSDYGNKIPVGNNQISHATLLNEKYEPPYCIYPNITPYCSESNEFVYTFAISFIYPSYKNLIEDFTNEYNALFDFLIEKTQHDLETISDDLRETLVKNLIRGIFIQKVHSEDILNLLEISIEDKRVKTFLNKLKCICKKIQEINIEPMGIGIISIPNGMLNDTYFNNKEKNIRFRSGKTKGTSARFYFGDGFFEILKEEGQEYPRVLFIKMNEEDDFSVLEDTVPLHLLYYSLNGSFPKKTTLDSFKE